MLTHDNLTRATYSTCNLTQRPHWTSATVLRVAATHFLDRTFVVLMSHILLNGALPEVDSSRFDLLLWSVRIMRLSLVFGNFVD